MVNAEHTPTGFEAVSHARWRAELERELDSRSAEGLPIEALYEDTPGRFAPLPARLAPGWRAEVDIDAGGDLDEARDALRRDVAHGVRGLRFHDLRPFNLDYLVDGIDLREVALYFEGGDPIEFGQALLRVTHETKVSPKLIHGGFGARGRAATADFARWARVEFREMSAARISVVEDQEAGAGEALQLGLALAEGADKLREWTAAGFELELCSRALEFEFALGTDVFLELAKLRAARLAWARLVAALGGDATAQNMRVATRASRRSWTRRATWVNLLRGTSMTFAAASGGADSFTLLPFDTCLGRSGPDARRLAAGTQQVLAREARVGAVVDPAAGSGYVEALTAELAREGWRQLQEIESRGGIEAARTGGWVEEARAPAAEVEQREVRTRRRGIVGVSEYPPADERVPRRPPHPRPCPDTRLALPFEALRDRSDAHLAHTGTRPRAFLAKLGAAREHRARAIFARDLLAVGGLESLASGDCQTIASAVAAFVDSRARLCVVCAGDERLAADLPELARELSERAGVVVVAGRPGEHEAAWRGAGVRHFIHLGCDAVAVLEELLEEAGARA